MTMTWNRFCPCIINIDNDHHKQWSTWVREVPISGYEIALALIRFEYKLNRKRENIMTKDYREEDERQA
jgi:hypothetical protein